MTSEPKPIAAQSFEAWWNDKRRLGFIPSPPNAAIAVWNHQQAKIDENHKLIDELNHAVLKGLLIQDELEKKLALAREGIVEIEESAKHNMSTQGVWIRGKCVIALAAIDGETKCESSPRT